MLIKEISIQNFKSFGNNKQTIKFDNNNGSLILLCGENGTGKSSFQETLDFTLFGVVRGKERKRIPQTELPNRINGSLLTSIKFINENKDNIHIDRGLKPLKLKVDVNSNDITTTYKKYSQDKKEELIGMNYEIYKSFISMSLNDFTNFINLDADTKRKLLNRLFNLEELDSYYQITKDIIKNNKRNLDKIRIDFVNNLDTINTYKQNIENIKNLKEDDNNESKNEIKDKILSKKSRFIELKENINDIKKLVFDLNEDISNRHQVLNAKNHRLDKIELKIEDYENKIKIFEKGQCPTCNTVLRTDKHSHNLNNFIEDKKKLLDEKIDIKNDIIDYKKESKDVFIKRNSLNTELKNYSIEYKELSYELKSLKKEYDNFNENNIAILEIEKNIKKLKQTNEKLDIIIKDIDKKNDKYEQLNEIFSMNGLRKSIIESTVKPINKYLTDYLEELGSSFRVEINNEFDAEIYERHINKVHPETLSTGEARKINVAIALSYLEIIRKVRNSNILFLDEIFANVDIENIDILLKALKRFSEKYKVNIIVISQDQSPFDMDLFDRVITMEKNTFSMINDENKRRIN